MKQLSVNIDTLKELIKWDETGNDLLEYIKILIEKEEEVVESDALPKHEVVYLQSIWFNDFYGSSCQIFYKAVGYIYDKIWYILDDDTKWCSSFIINRNTKNFNEWDLNTKTQKLLDNSSYDSILEMIHDVSEYNKWLGKYAKDISTLNRLRKALSALINKVHKNTFDKFSEFYKCYKKKWWYDLCKEIYKQKIINEEEHNQLMLWTQRYMMENDTKYLKKPEKFLRDWDRKSYIGKNDEDFYRDKAIERLDIWVYEKFLHNKYWLWDKWEPLKKRKQVLHAIRKRVEELWGDTSDPSTWKDLLFNTHRS